MQPREYTCERLDAVASRELLVQTSVTTYVCVQFSMYTHSSRAGSAFAYGRWRLPSSIQLRLAPSRLANLHRSLPCFYSGSLCTRYAPSRHVPTAPMALPSCAVGCVDSVDRPSIFGRHCRR
jgi:hypothetical protein